MDKANSVTTDASEEKTIFNRFVFSRPNTISDHPQIVNFGTGSNTFDTQSNEKNIFTFTVPTIVSQYDEAHTSSQVSNSDRYKSKFSKSVYKPTVNMFASALRDTQAFERLKKNSRSHATKINIDYSITCFNVPKALLTKTTAKEYFMQYGQIVKITIRPRRQIITVTYTSKEEANVAYYSSGNYMNERFQVEWTQFESLLKSSTKKKDLHKNMVANLLKADDDEIKSELAAMTNLEYNLHSKKRKEEEFDNLFPIKAKIAGGKTTLSHEKSTTKLEKATAKVEKFETESQIIKPLSNTSIEELQSIIHQVALTAEDKYKVLEARDRLMRLKRIKPSSLATAKITSGTCPDMCPEKERLMRESQRQVAPYEQLEGNEYKINHTAAIKQYSRSSADQEEPMPHELRPIKSLKMTMSYLLHEITDLCEQENTNLAEWYHFLWDRTRGIRKDITQQELCCTDTVELIEQCARFHIVCSERLCAEDASVFDKKINSENLTKCLQTLKYMYHDLRVKNIICKNEPEFRAYIVLLNLNNGNFLYDLQQLPKSIQNSSEIQFAINVYFALDANNYYKFFKLVRKTTYMNACILLRYFNQVRVKAFSVMVKAYCRSISTRFPLYELMDILSFENENEIKYFCEQMGLNVSNDELYILLNRQNFNMPGTNLQQGRACNLIESKRIVLNFSIGQCIAGEKMPDKTYKNHKPHNSFDAHGNLMFKSINAADQNSDISMESDEFTKKEIKKTLKPMWIRDKNQTVTSSTQIIKQPINANNEFNTLKSISVPESVDLNVGKTTSESEAFIKQRVSTMYANKSLLTVQSKIISDKINNDNAAVDMINRENVTINNEQLLIFGNNSNINNNNPFTNFPKKSETCNAESTTPFAVAVNEGIFSGTRSGNKFMNNFIPSSVFVNRFPESISTQQSVNANVANRTTIENVSFKEEQQKNVHAISETEKTKLEKLEYKKKIRQIEEQSEEIYNDLHAEITHEFCCAITKEEIDKLKMYDILSERIASDTVDEVIQEMCNATLTVEINSQRRLQAALIKIKNRVILKYFNIWRQYTLKRKRQRQALEDTPVWLQKQSVEECAKMLYSKEQDVVIQRMRKRKCESESVADNKRSFAPIEFIIHAGIRENIKLLDINPSSNVFWKLVISWPNLSNRAVLWYYKKMMNEYLYPNDFTMDPIIKVYRPNPHETLYICIRHFEGLISEHNLVGADALFFIADASEDYKFVSKRLTKTVLSRHKLMPISLSFIVLGDGNLENQNENIVSDLETFLESGYISEYTIMFEKTLTPKIILNLTQSTFLWLTMNKSPSNPLEMDYLHNVYDICLSEELWLRILGDSMFNKQLSNALRDPNFIINLHNEAVNHLIDIILDPESTMYTNFAPEFKKFLKINSTMPCSYEYFDESWKQHEYRTKLETAMNSFLLPPWNASWPIIDVHNLRQCVMNYCDLVLSNSNCNIIFYDILSNFSFVSENLQVSNFVNILLHIIKEKLRLLVENQIVIYNKNHIKHFRTLPWWFKSNVLTEFMSRESNSDNGTSNEVMKKKRKIDELESDLDESILDENFDSLAKFCENTKNQVMEIHSSSKDIETRLQAQQSQIASLDEKLKNALLDEID